MKKNNKLYLEDIQNAIGWILDDYLFETTFDEFREDHKTQDAVIRQIAIIGEALNKVGDDFLAEHSQLPTKEAVAMRNVLVHDYDMVDVKELWKTSQEDLPKLRNIVGKILKTI